MRIFVLCIQIRFVSTEKNYSHRLACILLIFLPLHVENVAPAVNEPVIDILFNRTIV